MQLLLISSSFVAGKDYLEHAREAVKELLASSPNGEVLFVPFAAHESKWDEYSASAEKFFESLGESYRSLHTCPDMVDYIQNTKLKMIFIGGGNTFLLLKTLQDKGLVDPIRAANQGGVSYMGTSAGSNVACPTIQTTNDMPVVEPANFAALDLVDFQINPHFVPGHLLEGHQGETREQRITEYLKFNDRAVIGLPESSWLRVSDDFITLGGDADAVIFAKDKPSRNWTIGTELNLEV
jgi:dipeptidase E